MIVESNGPGCMPHVTCHIPSPMHGHSISPESEKIRRAPIYPEFTPGSIDHRGMAGYDELMYSIKL